MIDDTHLFHIPAVQVEPLTLEQENAQLRAELAEAQDDIAMYRSCLESIRDAYVSLCLGDF